jgi:hypothetical protein
LSHRFKNTTAGDLQHARSGVMFPAGTYIDLTEGIDLFLVLDSQMVAWLVAGTLIYNTGTIDLTAAIALQHLAFSGHAKYLGFDNLTNGFVATKVQEAIEEAKANATAKMKLYCELNYRPAGAMSNASWFNRGPGANISGSYSGWPSAFPLVIPFNCSLTRVCFNLSAAGYDWRNSGAGNIFAQLAAYSHAYNGTTAEMQIDLTITGSFTGGSFVSQNIEREMTSWAVNSGSTSFVKGKKLGFQFRKDISKEGQCYSITNPYLLLEFTET